MKTQRLVAAGIAVLVVVWIVLPRPTTSFSEEPDSDPVITAVSIPQQASAEDAGFTVRASRTTARPFTEQVRVRGRTRAFREVEVRAEESGRIVGELVARGQRVEAGDVLCEIAVDSRQAELAEAESRHEQARLEYDAARDLRGQGLLSAVAQAQARADYDATGATLERARLALENTRVKAPFSGVVESRPVEMGALLERGGICATVLDDNPMLLVGLISEQDIGKLNLGATVTAELLNGRRVTGTVTYLARSADALSRSYAMEAEIAPLTEPILDGITAEIFIAASRIDAHLIPASALTLDDAGDVGVKTLNADNLVGFQQVTIVGDETGGVEAGVWVTGLPAQATIITHGQEIVFPGQHVESDFSWSRSGP